MESSLSVGVAMASEGNTEVTRNTFPRMSICLENGKTFTILAHNANEKNVYIQSARLNGKEYDKNYFTHQDIVQGGTLEFQMGPNPNPNWGASTLSLPPETMK